MRHKQSAKQCSQTRRFFVLFLSMLLIFNLVLPVNALAEGLGSTSEVQTETEIILPQNETETTVETPESTTELITEQEIVSSGDSEPVVDPAPETLSESDSSETELIPEEEEILPDAGIVDVVEDTEDEVTPPIMRAIRSISGSNTVEVGETITLTSDSTANYHRWSLSNSTGSWSSATTNNDYVRITNQNSTQTTVTGVGVGTTTIYHQTRSRNSGTWTNADQFTVTVRDTETVTFTPSISNASVIYYHYTGNDNLSGFSFSDFEELSNGVSFTSTYDTSNSNYWVFFVKPNENYMLSGMATTGSNGQNTGWIYDFTGGNYGTNNYPNVSVLGDIAKDNGYIAIFGYSRAAGNTIITPISVSVSGVQPQITVSAEASPSSGVIPGESVTFAATITPGAVPGSNATVIQDGVMLNSITINGNAITEVYTDAACTNRIAVSDLRASSAVTVYIPYETTVTDFTHDGLATMEVNATVTYETRLTTSGQSGSSTFVTHSVIQGSAQTNVQIAPSSLLTYSFDYDPTNLSRPVDFPTPPASRTFYENEIVTLESNNYDNVTDSSNGGYWEFDGWYDITNLTVKLGDTMTMLDTNAKFIVGHWRFVKTTMFVSVIKDVTGNMGDRDKLFSFTVTTADGEEKNFSLKDDGSHTIENLAIGSTITLAESGNAGYAVSVQYGSYDENGTFQGSMIQQAANGDFSITLEEGKDTILVTNNKDAVPDTGILMDSVPYVLILMLCALAAIGIITLYRRRKVQ